MATDVAINVNKPKVLEILEHLIRNAVKYSKEGGIVIVRLSMMVRSLERLSVVGESDTGFLPLHVSPVVGRGLPQVRIEISDSGAGISLEDQRRLTGDTIDLTVLHAERCGSGLSMFVARCIMNLHAGGGVSIQSEVDRGYGNFIFVIYFQNHDCSVI